MSKSESSIPNQPQCGFGSAFPGTGVCSGEAHQFLVGEADTSSTYMPGCTRHKRLGDAVEKMVKARRPVPQLTEEEIDILKAALTSPKYRPASFNEIEDQRHPLFCPLCKYMAVRMPIVELHRWCVCSNFECSFKQAVSLMKGLASEDSIEVLVEESSTKLLAAHPDMTFLLRQE